MPATQHNEDLDKDLQNSLVDIFKAYEKEDDEIRKAMIKAWKKNEEYWHGVQYIFWSAKDESWRSPADINWQDDFTDEELDELGSFYDYVVNIFRGHGEAIIAALSAQIPALRFIPDDADDPDDVITARTFDKIGDLIQRHNKAKLLALQSFFYLYLNGIVVSYIYKDSDFKYGSYKIPEFGVQKVPVVKNQCEDCGYEWELDAAEDNSESQESEIKRCPQCASESIKSEEDENEVPEVVGEKSLPKTRVKIDVLGGLQVKLPWAARNQAECHYAILYSDINKEMAIEMYPDIEEDIDREYVQNFDRFARTEFTFPSDPEVEQKNLVTFARMDTLASL
jgi:hypothetical protein